MASYAVTPSRYFIFIFALSLSACLPYPPNPSPGPDKQAVGTWYGAMLGAGSGAVTGFQLSVGAGPGAAVGASLGAVWGMLSGLGIDMLEEDQFRRTRETEIARERAWVQEVLAEHYSRRLELHPSRDIYPADWFFNGDDVNLTPYGRILVTELAHMTKTRMPWSRIVIATYVTSSDKTAAYPTFLTKRRAETIAHEFIRSGIEPRRVLTQPVVLDDPILVDPDDTPGRYRQAVEIIPVDR